MAYIELSDVLFRGELRGATGTARFKLTANAVNAVDTLHIAGNQVTYSTYLRWWGGPITNGSTMFSHVVSIPDDDTFVEVIAYANNASYVTVDGVRRQNRNRRGPNLRSLPYVEIIPLTKGTHTITLISGVTRSSTDGYILCRYIRRTGSSNL